MKYLLALFAVIMCFDGDAQITDISAFASEIDTAELRRHLFHIASADMEGRETATEGQRRAAAYIEEQLAAKGFRGANNGSFEQRFPVYRDSLVQSLLSVGGKYLRRDTDYAVSYSSLRNVSVDHREIVFAGYGNSDSTRNDYEGIQAAGKVVLVIPGAPVVQVKGRKRPVKLPDILRLQEAAGKNSAAVLLVVDSRFPRSRQPALGPMYVNRRTEDSLPPTFFISDSVARTIMGAAYDSIKTMTSGVPSGRVYPVEIAIRHERTTQRLSSTNVIGIFDGTTKKDEAVIITAHYDHLGKRDSLIFFGADDDGSGTATLLELADAISTAAAAGVRPARSIIIMAVSGEEKGLWGSEYYSMNPVLALDKTSASINIDMIGRIEAGRRRDSLNYIYVVGDNRLSSELRPISESVNRKYLNLKLDYKFNDPDDPQRIFYRSDHYNFAKNGVPAIFYFNGLHDDYHRPTDTPDKINYALLARRAQLILYTTWEIANRETMLKRDIF